MSEDKIYVLQDYATLDLTEGDGDTATAVAGIQEVTLSAGFSLEHLYTADSVKRVSSMQHEAMVTVDIGFSFWDGDVAGQWLGGSGGTTATSLTDTSDPQEYELTGTFTSKDGSQEIDVTVTGITFESMPLFEASRGEFVQWDLSGEGKDVTNYEVAAPA